MNTASGWSFLAHGLVQYEDGTIEWDSSTGGVFHERRLKEYLDSRKQAATSEILHRQISLANAMLCFLI